MIVHPPDLPEEAFFSSDFSEKCFVEFSGENDTRGNIYANLGSFVSLRLLASLFACER